MNEIKIICDSLSDITDKYIEKYDIEMIPLNIIINGREYKDRVDLDGEKFYKLIRDEKVVPKTSQITYADFYQVFEKYAKEGMSILYISAAAKATGTYQSAMLAKGDLEEADIHIVDSNSLSFGIALAVIKACELRDEGKSIEQIIDVLENEKDNTYVTFFCDDLDYLSKGGRISSVKAKVGTVLGIKPICVVNDGLVDNVANARGKKHIANKMIEVARENGVSDLTNQTVYIGYTDDIKERDRLEEAIVEELNPRKIEYFMIGSGIGTHGGPGTTGFICKKV